MSVSPELAERVRERACHRGEYCRMHQSLQGGTFQFEHIIPQSLGGHSTFENLALACPACNLHKADRTLASDPESGENIPFFNPRTDVWSDHFFWDGYRVAAATAITASSDD